MKNKIIYIILFLGAVIICAELFYFLCIYPEKRMPVGGSVKDTAVIQEALVIDDATTAAEDYESFLNKPYQFSDFHVDFKEYKAADVRFEKGFELRDDPNYWNDWKEIFADVNSSDHDFAGHFKLFSAGNGTMRNLFLVDGLTGIIYPSTKNIYIRKILTC